MESYEIYRITEPTSAPTSDSKTTLNTFLIIIIVIIILTVIILIALFLFRTRTVGVLPEDDVVNLETLTDISGAQCCQPEFGLPNELFLRDDTTDIIYTRSCEGCEPSARKGSTIYFEFATGTSIPQCTSFVECP